MNCCAHGRSANKLFSKVARRYRKRFARRGLEAPQKSLYQALVDKGIQHSSILEVGCGVGQFHMALLEGGAQSAVGIDLAEAMIREAKIWAEERQLDHRTEYYVGDFMSMSEIESQSIVLMDKVICCYPDGEGMVKRGLEKSQDRLALIYPRDKWYNRAGIAFGKLIMKMIRADFQPYFHAPTQVAQWADQMGFKPVYEKKHFIWLVEIYQKQTTSSYTAKES